MECNSVNFTENVNLNRLKSETIRIIDQQINSNKINFASVYFRDLNNGPWFGINESELFSPSSLIKVPLMMTYYHLAETDSSILNKIIVNDHLFDPNRQNFQPEVTLKVGESYPVSELIDRMIIYSDDQAYDLLNNNLPNSDITQIYNDLGIDISAALKDPNGNILPVVNYASFFRILFNASYLNKENSEKALKLLSQSKFKDGLVAGVPQNIVVAHKFGERQYLATGDKQFHDCGIVYKKDNPYLICIMTRGREFTPLIETIKTISKNIYEHQEGKH